MVNVYVWHTRQMDTYLFYGYYLGKDEKTQHAEAMNSFFRNFVNRKLSLVEIYMRFGSELASKGSMNFRPTM